MQIGDEIFYSYNIPPRLRGARLENYKAATTEQERALKRCSDYSANAIENIKIGKGLFLHGGVGTGKTHLAVATAYDAICRYPDKFSKRPGFDDYDPGKNGYRFSFIPVVDLLDAIRDSYSGKKNDIIHRAKADELIVLDDIGAEKPTDWVEERLYALIDLRYRMQRSTIYTTNCTVAQLEAQIGARAISRIIEMTDGIKFDGPDYRRKKLK